MQLSRSSAVVPRLTVLEHAGSTNDELVRAATGADAASWPELSVIVTDDQRSGRGRLGRTWSAPAGTSLAVSVLLRPEAAADAAGSGLSVDSLGWIPLLAGLAMTRAVRGLGVDATLKWPNDVMVDGKKLCGILSELLPGATGVVVGAGLNVSIGSDQLPVDTATSLALSGVVDPDPDAALAAYLTHLQTLYRGFVAAGGDAEASGLRRDVASVCDTVGRAVRVQLPTGEPLLGTAIGLDELGRLIVDTGGSPRVVAAGDVTHLRY
ncbi:MAG: biotin--[acetyl-CoA-carboxylase] ligase [Microbacteriaceae bacterium]|nr:MAG: biotin--[acetyl-CoA-carboxylase] ligase [Microbacteriaceae bacterium]